MEHENSILFEMAVRHYGEGLTMDFFVSLRGYLWKHLCDDEPSQEERFTHLQR